MASGSSGRNGSGSKGFDFGTDDVLCSYDDLGSHETSNGKRTDSHVGTTSAMDSWESRIGRSSINAYNQQEASFSQEVISTVEKTLKKHADNILRFLEGISVRLSQLELYCYNLEQSIGELRSDLTRDHDEADLKLKSLEKHLQEVHRSVQILRDKQELSDTQKELAKLQLVKEATTTSYSQNKDDGVASSASEPKKHDHNAPDTQNKQSALALPHHTASVLTSIPARAGEAQYAQPALTPPPPQQTVHVQPPPLASHAPQQTLPVQQPALTSLPPQQVIHVPAQPGAYYQQTQFPHQLPQSQRQPQDQHLQGEIQYAPQRPQMQDPSRQASQPQPLLNQAQNHPFPQYQQQWSQPSPQQFPQQAQLQTQMPNSHAQIRSQTPPVYPPYPHQPMNPSPEAFQCSMPMQVPFSGVSQPGASHSEAGGYGYGVPGRTVQSQLPQHDMQQPARPHTNQSTHGANLNDGSYPSAISRLPQSSMHGHMMYDTDGSRPPHPPHFQQGGAYSPTHVSALQKQQAPPGTGAVRHPNSQIVLNHPYSEMIEKAASMGYPRDQVANVIHRMEESGQPVDFNSLLDRLNSRF